MSKELAEKLKQVHDWLADYGMEASAGIVAEAIAALRSEPVAWMPIETAPKGRKLIVGYWNVAGKWRTITAQHWLPDTLESEHTESGYADEGWYEASEAYEEFMPVDCEPTHWMPLPAAPSREDQRESNSNPAPVHGQSKTGLTGSHPGAPTQDADELLRNGAAGLRGYATLLHFNGNLNDAKKYNAQADAIDAYLSRKEQ